MNRDHMEYESPMTFKNDFITEVMEWSVESLFSKLWMDPVWMKCAKGGNERDYYSHKSDMYYIIHIFSGTAMALQVLDYKYLNDTPEDINSLKEKLKISIFGYLFHDFNKLKNYEENKNMDDRTVLDKELEKFSTLMEELHLSKDDVYFIAFSTEKGTEYRSNSENISLNHNLQFESSFSRLADSLSSMFSDDTEDISDVYFDNIPCIPKTMIHKIRVSSTTFITISSFLRKELVESIVKSGGFYLWSTLNSIYYVNKSEIEFSVDALSNKLLERVSLRAHLEDGISFTDRKINVSSSNIGSINKKILVKFVTNGKKFKQVLHLEDIKLNEGIKLDAEKYSDKISNTISYSLNFYKEMPKSKTKGPRSVREYLAADDIYIESPDTQKTIDEMDEQEFMGLLKNNPNTQKTIDERLHAFYIRYVQLQTSLQSNQACIIRKNLTKTLAENISMLKGLLPKNNEYKSAFLIPLFMTSSENSQINWNEIENNVISDMNSGSKNKNNKKIVSEIIQLILNMGVVNLPQVPDKMSMSMITGYPAENSGHVENLFGLGTNSFNNRLPTSGLPNGKIDQYTIFEFSLRHVLAPKISSKYSSAVMFLSFPGAIPFMDMGKFLKLASNVDSDLKVNNINLTIEDDNAKLDNFKLDSTYYIYLNDPKKDSDLLKYLKTIIDIAIKSKLHIMLSFSNNIFYQSWKETILVELESSVLNGMGWNKIRCNNIFDVEHKLRFFLNSSKSEKTKSTDYDNASVVIKDYIRDNFSLSYYVHKQFFGSNHALLSNPDDIELMRELIYGKHGGKMKKMEELGEIAAGLYRLNYKSSASDRGWMIRESLEVLEKMKAETKPSNLADLKEFVSGHLSKNLERLLKREKPDMNLKPKNEEILNFTDILFSLINDEFKGKIPSGITRSYLIDAFEIEYMLASDKKWNKE